MELFLLTFLPFVIAAGLWLFLRTDECWDEYRQATGFKVFHASIVIIAIPVTLWWAEYVWSNTEKRSQAHLETARNYEKDGNKEKALEYAIKAYESNQGSLEVIAYLGYVFWLQGNKDAFVKGRDILVSNSSRLDTTGKAALGVLEFALKNPHKAFHTVAILDLAAVAEYVLPWTVVALTYGAFETLPYEDALLKMKEGLVMIDRRAAMYDVKFAASSTKATGTWSPGPYNRLMAAKFYSGDIWLAKGREHRATQQIMDALKTIGQGWAIAFSPIPKDKIVHHFGYLNYVLIDSPGFLQANQKEVFKIFDEYIERLKGAKEPSYVSEITKFQLLRNCLIDLHAFNEEKRPVAVDDDLTFILSKWVADDTAVKEVILEPNFAIKDPIRPLAGKLPAKKTAFHETIVLQSKQKFEPTAKFVFPMYVEDRAGNQAKYDVCPNFFENQVSANRS